MNKKSRLEESYFSYLSADNDDGEVSSLPAIAFVESLHSNSRRTEGANPSLETSSVSPILGFPKDLTRTMGSA